MGKSSFFNMVAFNEVMTQIYFLSEKKRKERTCVQHSTSSNMLPSHLAWCYKVSSLKPNMAKQIEDSIIIFVIVQYNLSNWQKKLRYLSNWDNICCNPEKTHFQNVMEISSPELIIKNLTQYAIGWKMGKFSVPSQNKCII